MYYCFDLKAPRKNVGVYDKLILVHKKESRFVIVMEPVDGSISASKICTQEKCIGGDDENNNHMQ